MVRLLYTEFLKMKNSSMIYIFLLGGVSSPLLTFFMLLGYHYNNPDEPLSFINFFDQTHLFITLLVGILLFALITTYLFNREYEENTIINLLTIPVGRWQMIMSKIITLFIWIIFIMLLGYLAVIILGFLGGFGDLKLSLLIMNLKKYLLSGFLLFLLMPVNTFITILFKNYIPSLAFSISATLGALIIGQSKYVALYPWGIPGTLTADMYENIPYASWVSWSIILVTFFVSLAASIIYFIKADIN